MTSIRCHKATTPKFKVQKNLHFSHQLAFREDQLTVLGRRELGAALGWGSDGATLSVAPQGRGAAHWRLGYPSETTVRMGTGQDAPRDMMRPT
jgi:hypothetical protein